jgi:GntR family transcriptional repressor for pyruvate dehydrogenase complex
MFDQFISEDLMEKTYITGKVKNKTKCDMVADKLISMISQGVYKEGDKLPPEAFFVESFGVSRVTIRESFKKLNTLGIVTIHQGEGTYVNRIGLDTMVKPLLSAVIMDDLNVNQIYEARLYVELGNVHLAAQNHTAQQMEQLKELIVKMRYAADRYDSDFFSDLDADFHELIGKMSGNYILLTMYTTVKDILYNYIKKTNLSREAVLTSLGHHVKIMESIEMGDGTEASRVMEEHVEHAKNKLLEQINQ